MQGPRLYGVAEFAEALGWDRSRVSKYLTREAVPEPYARLASGPVWTEEQVTTFIKEGKKMSGEDLKMWPVRPREDVPYLLGRVCAVAGHALELSGHNADKDVQLASTSTGALGQMVGRATVAAGGLGARGEELKELIGEIMGSIRNWPEELSNEEQAEWWLGYYHQKTALDKEPQDCIFTVDGTEYMFEVWHGGQNDVLVALYTAETGETFGIWTAETDSLPETQEEAGDFIRNMDWAVEDMETLRREGFKRAK